MQVLPVQDGATEWERFELGPGGETELDFELPSGVPVVGRVTEKLGGRAIPGAIVGEGHQFLRTAVTDTDGRYRLEGIGGLGAYGLSAKAKGYGMAMLLELPSVVDGEIHVDFELPRAWSASGQLVEATGAPVANALITAGAAFHVNSRQWSLHSSCRSDQDGRFRIEDLSPGGRFGFTVRAPGLAQYHGWLPKPDEMSGECVLG
ncbi:MAG: carboxypeptidase-like regulatory domain-containing protein, partial [Planctomycetota bacterium]